MPEPLGVFGPGGDTPFGLEPGLLRPLVGRLDGDLRKQVARYLRNGTVVIALMEYTEDVLEGRFGVSGGSGVMTDGAYYWRCDAAQYVETYGIGLDQSIVDHMERAGWQAPPVSPATLLRIDGFLVKTLRRVT
ncbi:hypothetical protein [Amycolatopsis vancoresmycina]|uniref:hypothetical protein n=1 Tax=Amycolatopsis vancoresmycina TaxID=208444 RepID=UPI0012DE73CA|nr:hypothetical protein [Amycolatopsis vancoresmycina]